MAINWTAIAVTAVAAKAYGTLYQGYAMAAYYQGKADIALLQGRTKGIEAKENGVKVLQKLNETIASNIAKGAAGGVTPFDGSMSVLNQMRKMKNTFLREEKLSKNTSMSSTRKR